MSHKVSVSRVTVTALVAGTLVLGGSAVAHADPVAPPVMTGGSQVSFGVPSLYPGGDPYVTLHGTIVNLSKNSHSSDFSFALKCGSASPISMAWSTSADDNLLSYSAEIPATYVDWECTLSASTTNSRQSIRFMPAAYTVEKGAVAVDAVLVTFSESGGLY